MKLDTANAHVSYRGHKSSILERIMSIWTHLVNPTENRGELDIGTAIDTKTSIAEGEDVMLRK
jgi:hypothetical protein